MYKELAKYIYTFLYGKGERENPLQFSTLLTNHESRDPIKNLRGVCPRVNYTD
jgi:hypothetical protein